MYQPTVWEDHVSSRPGIYKISPYNEAVQEYTIEEAGAPMVQGTPQDMAHFNHMERGTFEAILIGNENTRLLCQALRDLDGVRGLAIDVTLTNSMEYPFNNSQTTVVLPILRNANDYYVIPEVVSYSGGFVGSFAITDKLVNGFKVAHSGSASSVIVRLHVIGGM